MSTIKKFRIKSFKKKNPMISFKKIKMLFGKRIVLDEINFEINKGEIFGMLGPNGVGKSTIFNLVTGLISPEKGSIFIVGEKVNNFQIGDEVVALTNWGGFSEFVKVNSKFVEIKSKEMPFDVAASMTVNYGTSYHALVERAKIQSNQDILVLGASGGIGLAAIEISKAYGCRVTAVASSEEKLLACKKYGADKLILNKDNNLKSCLKNNVAGKFDIIYDPIGGQRTVDSLSFIKWQGTVLIMGFASGDIPAPPLNRILLKGCSLVGVLWGPFAKGNDDFNLECIKEINSLYDKNLIKIVKPELFPIDKFKEALLKIKNRKSIGKLCLCTNSYINKLKV